MAAAIGVEARCQPVSGEDLEQRLKGRSRAFLFDRQRVTRPAGDVGVEGGGDEA
jgi:hypothetical protein